MAYEALDGQLVCEDADWAVNRRGVRVHTVIQLWKNRAGSVWAVRYSQQKSAVHHKWVKVDPHDPMRPLAGVSVKSKSQGGVIETVIYLHYVDGGVSYAAVQTQLQWSTIAP